MSTRIDNRLAYLSERQREVVAWEDGVALVLGGPGTGKTRVLTERAARLLADQRKPNTKILGLTFTNRAASAMKKRLKECVPRHRHMCTIRTYHGMCADLLREFGHKVGVPENFTICPNLKCLEQSWEAAQLTRTIGHDRLEAVARSQSGPSFESILKEEHILDYHALMETAIKLLDSHPKVAAACRGRYRYWLIDEFQDTNRTQFSLLNALAGGCFTNIMLAGDDDQNIFEWNGSSISYIGDIKRKYKAKIFYLETNYRSASVESIMRASSVLVSRNTRRFRIPERTARENQYRKVNCQVKEPEIRCLRFPDQTTEHSWIAEDIAQYDAHRRGNLAVLARRSKTIQAIAKQLRSHQIKVYEYEQGDSFKTPEFRWMFAALQLVLNPMSKLCLAVVICEFSAVCTVRIDLSSVLKVATAKRCTYLAAWCELVTRRLNPSWALDLVSLVSQFERTDQDSMQLSDRLFTTVQEVQTMSEYADNPCLMDHLNYDIAVWKDLTQRVLRMRAHDIDFSTFIHQLQVNSKRPNPQSDAVKISTIHSVKGLEYDVVYIADCVEGTLPDFRSKTLQLLEQERRVCFVAMTRARQAVFMTYAEQSDGWNRNPSRFISEMGVVTEEPKHVLIALASSDDAQETDGDGYETDAEFDIEDYDEHLQPLIKRLHATGKFMIEPSDDVVANGTVQGHYEAKLRSGESTLYFVDESLEKSGQVCSGLAGSKSSVIVIDCESPPSMEEVLSKFATEDAHLTGTAAAEGRSQAPA